MIRSRLLRSVFLGSFIPLLLTCSHFHDESRPPDQNGKTANGYFNIIVPGAGDRVRIDSTALIVWFSSGGISDSQNVGVYLCRDDSVVDTIAAARVNNGVSGWTVHNAGSGDDFRIKICALPDTQHYDFSAYFSIFSGYSGTITVTMPAAGSRLMMDSMCMIRWTSTGSPGPTLNLKLYYDTTFVSLIVQNMMTGMGSYSWSPVGSSLGSGARYRIKATSDYDAGIFSYSDYFTIASHFTGRFTFTAPTNSSVWIADSQYYVKWDTSGNPGATVDLQLYIDSTRLAMIAAGKPNSGIYSWTLPNTMTSGARYRIKIVSAQDPGIYAYSENFTIAGISPDVYEPDNIRGSASLLISDSTQRHTITLGDTDWVRFSADSGSPYIIRDSGGAAFRTSVNLFLGPGVSAASSNSANASGVLVWPWLCTKSGTWYARINSSVSSDAGSYSLTVSALDPQTSITFISPTSSSTVIAGASSTINWVPDSVILGATIQLYLYKGGKQFAVITATSAPNSGSYSWAVGTGYVTGSDYQIKIANSSSSRFCGFSRNFTISGMTPDAYEVDNTRGAASILSLGATQQHTITFNDTDWIKFTADSGTRYIIRDTGISAFMTNIFLYYGTDTAYTFSGYSPFSGVLAWMWTCAKSGTWYARINSYTAQASGAYSFGITTFDSSTVVTFINPTSASTLTAGASNAISWVADSSILGAAVQLYLYKGGRQIVAVTAASAPNNGSYSWLVPAGFVTGGDYQIRIFNSGDNRFYGYSRNFTINGMTPDAYEVDDTRGTASALSMGSTQQHNITYNDTDWVRFTADSGSQYIIVDKGVVSFRTSLSLYYGADAYYSASNSTNSSGVLWWPWLCAKSGTCFIMINAYTAGGSGTYSFGITKFDSLSSIVFTSPLSSATFIAGVSNTISWTTDSNVLGTSVQLYLYKGGIQIMPITATSAPNSGGYSWAPPAGLVSGSDYQIKIVNDGENRLFGYSRNFIISGMAPDAYEPDNPRTLAAALTFGSVQQHNITYNDTDWVKFAAESGYSYLFKSAGPAGFTIYANLYFGANTDYTASFSSGWDGLLSGTWVCGQTGTYYMRINASAAGATGNYSCKVFRYDPRTVLTFTNPTASTMISAGSNFTITWAPDTSVMDTAFFVYLYTGDTSLGRLNGSNQISNNGSFTLLVPSAALSGSNYHFEFHNENNEEIISRSPVFSIVGSVTPDAYEPDNDASQATVLTLGTPQKHNLFLGDVDWVKFTLNAGTTYAITFSDSEVPGTEYLYLYDATNTFITIFTFQDFMLTDSYTCTRSGTYYGKIFSSSYSPTYYSLNIKP